MEANRREFSNEISELENLASGFKQFAEIENYEEIAQNAKNIKQKIDEANERAKQINNRETLVEQEDVTDYTAIP